MSKFHVEAIFKEFPWLHALFDQSKITDAKVRRLDAVILEDPIATFSYPERHQGAQLHCRAFFCDRRGTSLIQVGIQEVPCTKLERFFYQRATKQEVICETAGEALARLGERAAEAHYLVGMQKNVFGLFKPPKNFTVVEWLDRERERMKENVARTLADIDKID